MSLQNSGHSRHGNLPKICVSRSPIILVTPSSANPQLRLCFQCRERLSLLKLPAQSQVKKCCEAKLIHRAITEDLKLTIVSGIAAHTHNENAVEVKTLKHSIPVEPSNQDIKDVGERLPSLEDRLA